MLFKKFSFIPRAGKVEPGPEGQGSADQRKEQVSSYLAGKLKSTLARRLELFQSFRPSETASDERFKSSEAAFGKSFRSSGAAPDEQVGSEVKILRDRDIILYKTKDGWQIYLPIDVFVRDPVRPLSEQESKLEEIGDFKDQQKAFNLNAQWLDTPQNVASWLQKFQTKNVSLERSKIFDFYNENCLTKAELSGGTPETFVFNPYYCFLARLLGEPNRDFGNEDKQKHHIIPRFLGGPDDDSNLMELTVSEHICAHLLRYLVWNQSEDYNGASLLASKFATPDQLARVESLYNQEIKNFTLALLSSNKLL